MFYPIWQNVYSHNLDFRTKIGLTQMKYVCSMAEMAWFSWGYCEKDVSLWKLEIRDEILGTRY